MAPPGAHALPLYLGCGSILSWFRFGTSSSSCDIQPLSLSDRVGARCSRCVLVAAPLHSSLRVKGCGASVEVAARLILIFYHVSVLVYSLHTVSFMSRWCKTGSFLPVTFIKLLRQMYIECLTFLQFNVTCTRWYYNSSSLYFERLDLSCVVTRCRPTSSCSGD